MTPRGPTPLPLALKLRRGITKPSRVNYREPRPRKVRPERPVAMSKRARAIWDELAELLERVGVLSELDGRALADLAEVEAMLETTRRARVRRRRLMRTSKNGFRQTDELVALEIKLMREARRLRASFGLSPADRTRLATTEGPGRDGDDESDLDAP